MQCQYIKAQYQSGECKQRVKNLNNFHIIFTFKINLICSVFKTSSEKITPLFATFCC